MSFPSLPIRMIIAQMFCFARAKCLPYNSRHRPAHLGGDLQAQFVAQLGSEQLLGQSPELAALARTDTAEVASGFSTLSDAPHAIEIEWQAASYDGANDGFFTLWFDGTAQETVSGIDNDTMRVDSVSMGYGECVFTRSPYPAGGFKQQLPRFDRNSNTGGVITCETADQFQRAINRIFHDAAHPSHLILPLILR